jgi:hypothetical protein
MASWPAVFENTSAANTSSWLSWQVDDLGCFSALSRPTRSSREAATTVSEGPQGSPDLIWSMREFEECRKRVGKQYASGVVYARKGVATRAESTLPSGSPSCKCETENQTCESSRGNPLFRQCKLSAVSVNKGQGALTDLKQLADTRWDLV